MKREQIKKIMDFYSIDATIDDFIDAVEDMTSKKINVISNKNVKSKFLDKVLDSIHNREEVINESLSKKIKQGCDSWKYEISDNEHRKELEKELEAILELSDFIENNFY